MLRRLVPLASICAFATLLGSCNLLDSASQYLNIVNVKFSAEDPASSGPSIGGPSVSGAVKDAGVYALQGKSPSQIQSLLLSKYYLTDTFFVKGDNSGNSDTARFGTSLAKPVLLFRIDDSTGTPISDTIEPFVIPGGQEVVLKFPLNIPLTAIPSSVLKEIAAGDSVAYYLSGKIKFDLVTPAGTISGSSQTEISIASGKIPTRSTSLDISSLLSALGI